MIKNRGREAAIGISLAIFISLLVFVSQPQDSKTGAAYTSKEAEKTDDVLLAGTEFKVELGGSVYYYMYADDETWYVSTDELTWEKRPDMGNMWQGLYDLQIDDAKIYFRDTEVKDLGEFAKGFD